MRTQKRKDDSKTSGEYQGDTEEARSLGHMLKAES